MPKWIQLPTDKLFSQPDQQAFLEARRQRWCKKCKKSFSAVPPIVVCPICGAQHERGPENPIDRSFNLLTIIAGRRWGKSKVGSIAGTEESTFANTIGWACAPTNPKLHRYVIPAFQQLIPPDWVQSWSSEFLDLRLKNGSLIHFQTLEDPDQGRGQGLDWLWIDEVCELTKKHWEVISPSLVDRQGIAFFTTSPRSYDWVYEELYKPAEDAVPGYWACHAQTKDNPIISEEFLARERIRLTETMYRQEYEADFVIFTGAVYGGLIDNQILHTDAEIRKIIPEWPDIDAWRQVLVGIDTGADHPFGAVKLVSTEKGLVVVGEYLERDKTFVQHANAIRQMASATNAKFAINKNERQGMIELGQHNIFCQKAENDIVSGTERVKAWLHGKQMWFVESKCPLTIKQMKAYRWAENTSPRTQEKRTEKVFKLNDELPDCIRYATMTWPVLPTAPPEQEILPRDLSSLPGEAKNLNPSLWKRMKSLDDEPKPDKQDVVGDFWL